MKYCPLCKKNLTKQKIDGEERLACSSDTCDFVFWNNPIPVVAGIVEIDNKIVLAHNVSWPKEWFSIITGFLEKGETAEEGIARETKEELDLTAGKCTLVGVYSFHKMNQIIIAYHVLAKGMIKLNEELDLYKVVDKEELKPWDSATGYAVRDYLKSIKPE